MAAVITISLSPDAPPRSHDPERGLSNRCMLHPHHSVLSQSPKANQDRKSYQTCLVTASRTPLHRGYPKSSHRNLVLVFTLDLFQHAVIAAHVSRADETARHIGHVPGIVALTLRKLSVAVPQPGNEGQGRKTTGLTQYHMIFSLGGPVLVRLGLGRPAAYLLRFLDPSPWGRPAASPSVLSSTRDRTLASPSAVSESPKSHSEASRLTAPLRPE